MADFRSRSILGRPEWCFNRGVFKSMGFSDADLDKPIIGIANSWSELVPGSYNLRHLAEAVKKGIHCAGGTAVEFGVIGACDGTAQGNEGMHFILPSRELIANDIEIMVQAHRLDAVVLLGSCDKIVPGMLMAAARLPIPAVFLPGGPMLGGQVFDGRKSDLTSCAEGVGMLSAGRITQRELDELEEGSVPTCGSCSFLGTANTMCCLAEALGLGLPGSALIPAVFAERNRMAEQTGEAIVRLAMQGIAAQQILTLQSIKNAIRVLCAIGGSTNAVLHLTAIASELGIAAADIMKLIDELSDSTPQLVKVNPASPYNMEDFYFSGGIPRVLKELEPLLDSGCMTATGRTLGENLREHRFRGQADRNVIRTLDEPFQEAKGIAVLRGNLAPGSCITKPAAIDPSMHTFTGRARVFDSEEEAERAILARQILKGDVVVIRYEGPKGGPGMREMFKAMKYLYGLGLGMDTALITDGRFSGTNNGCFAGHISPEAAEGGPIAAVMEGDIITIDIANKTITLHVEDEELNRRLAGWQRPEPKYKTGYLGLYSRLAASAGEGAVLKLD